MPATLGEAVSNAAPPAPPVKFRKWNPKSSVEGQPQQGAFDEFAVVASLVAPTGAYFIPQQFRFSLTGTLNTTVRAKIRMTLADGVTTRELTPSGDVGSTTEYQNLSLTRPGVGSIFAGGGWASAEVIGGLGQHLSDLDQVTKIEVLAYRSNTTDNVTWEVEFVGIQVGE